MRASVFVAVAIFVAGSFAAVAQTPPQPKAPIAVAPTPPLAVTAQATPPNATASKAPAAAPAAKATAPAAVPAAAAAPAVAAKPAAKAASKKCMRLPLSDIAVGREETIAQARMRLGEYADAEMKTRGWKGPLTKSLETVSCDVYLVLPFVGTEYKCLVTATFCTP